MNIEKIQNLVSSLTKSLNDNEKLAIPILSAKLNKYAEMLPNDQMLGSISLIIDKMASNNNLFIRRAEFKSLYNKMFSNGSKFAEIFKDELGELNKAQDIKTFERDDSKEISSYHVQDEILSNALNSVFDKDIPLKMYSQKLADKALRAVSSSLNSYNLRPSSLILDQGSNKFLIIKADYETPKGITSFYVPIEINKTSEETFSHFVFIGKAGSGPQDLNHANIKNYLTKNAGNKLSVSGSIIMEMLTKASSEDREISGAELALTKLNAKRQGISEFFNNQIITGEKISEAKPIKDVSLPKYGEFESFEKSFTEPYGIASLQFGEEVVKLARNCVTRELISFGHKNPQIVVSGSEQNTIYLSVALNKGNLGFTVPIRVINGKASLPSIILCNGSVGSFSQETINALNESNQSNYKTASVASPLYNLKPSELISSIKTALNEGNSAKAEDALNVLANSGDDKAYAFGFHAFMQGLETLHPKTASIKEDKCSLIIKNAGSQHPICGHTNLPVHKTFKDKDGNCRPLYRKGMDEGYEATSFMNSKIFG